MKLISFATLCAQAFALFDGVTRLDSANWADTVENDKDHVWMVSFYADWCPHCKVFDTEFENAMNDPSLADKKVRFGAVNVMDSRDLTTRYGIKRSPTVKLFGQDKGTPQDYVGLRKQADVAKYVGDYSLEHNFLVPPPAPVHVEARYTYNIDAIVHHITAAHDERVYLANHAHQQDIIGLQGRLTADQQAVAAEF
jgi:thiol-disulfide isomerase/thioredoxin